MGPQLKQAAKRFTKFQPPYGISNLTKGDIRRLARRGGCKRVSIDLFDEAKLALEEFLKAIIRDAISYSEHQKRMTI